MLGRTPLQGVVLTRGRYRLRIRAEGRAETYYPILLERGSHWDGCAPGEQEPHAIELPLEGELGPDDIYVPGGYSYIGGDPLAADSLARQRVWIDEFVIRRFPVTNAEYLEFLNDLLAAGRTAEAVDCCPLLLNGSEQLRFERDANGRFMPGPDGPGQSWQPDCPVVLVDWYSAATYVKWLAEGTGKDWRLPSELEREKAARGADGRIFPWGDEAEATFACVVESFVGAPQRVPVHEYPDDESPYGVRGLAGNTRDWCGDIWRQDGPRLPHGQFDMSGTRPNNEDSMMVKGGAWASPINFSRSATRFGTSPKNRYVLIGIRPVRSYRSTG